MLFPLLSLLLLLCVSSMHSKSQQQLSSLFKTSYVKLPLNELLLNIPNKPLKNELLLSTVYGGNKLKNAYFGLRHGQSTSNLLGKISSNALVGSSSHGLTELGVNQAKESATKLKELINSNEVLFLSSNFTRARETAEYCIESLQKTYNLNYNYMIRTELNERYFGLYDDTDLLYYNRVWPIDQLDSTNDRYGVESIEAVITRLLKLISYYETNYKNTNIVCVSHADTLQIFNMLLCGLDARNFSQYRFNNGEVRDLSLTPSLNPVVYN